jgi:methyl-accepting chemotaxis protein
MHIKTIALAICGAITVTTVVATSLSLSSALNEHNTAASLLEAVDARVALYDATIDLSLERSLTQVGLNLPESMPASLRDLLTRQRGVADDGFKALFDTLAADRHLPQKDGFTSKLRTHLEDVARLRSEADPALGVGMQARDPALVKRIPSSIKTTVEEIRLLESKLLPSNVLVPGGVLTVENIQRLAWELREYGGRERTLLAIATATGAPIAPMSLTEAETYAARARSARDEILLLKDHSETPQAVRAAIDKVQATYFGTYDETRRRLLASAATGAYGMSLDAFFAESSAALATAEELATTAGAAAHDKALVARDKAMEAMTLSIGQGVLSLLMLAVLAWFLLRSVMPRMAGLSHEMRLLADGEIDRDLTAFQSKDEIGEMAAALKVFQDAQGRIRAMEAEQAELKAKAEAERRAELLAMAETFERSVGQVVETVAAASTELQASSETLSRTAQDTSGHAEVVARTADTSASNVQTVASASEEMSASIAEIAQQVGQSAQIAREAERKAAETNATVTTLATAAEKIGKVVSLISDIAAQTNLLALNATIEAARAGDAGRGFAVVASEVKSLAEQTARATDEISNQIAEVQGATGAAVTAIDGIAATISEINEISAAISAAVEEQMAAVREITRNTGDVAAGTAEVSQAIGLVQEGASETGAAAEQALGAARELGQQANRLRSEVDGFLQTIRAA